MIREVEVNKQTYEVDTTPLSPEGNFKYPFATIYGVSKSPASGVIANALRAMGKEPVTKALTEISEEEKRVVVKVLGWKFSRSQAWRNLWELWEGRMKKVFWAIDQLIGQGQNGRPNSDQAKEPLIQETGRKGPRTHYG